MRGRVMAKYSNADEESGRWPSWPCELRRELTSGDSAAAVNPQTLLSSVSPPTLDSGRAGRARLWLAPPAQAGQMH